ncbi:adenosylcobinamide-GDP ribazoletransferase [Candidatus Obscuribacterales bacterium]|nr:adenosylcobinamide-GDP ribazoletransferase [Candidatus Obscuribacterales bacterium]
MRIFRRFLLTLSYVTSFPLKGIADTEDYETSLSGLAKYLPSAGMVIGICLTGIAAVLLIKMQAPHIVSAAILTIAWLCITGGLHFDGLMDAADGIFSHRNKERMLEIMMDSRVGNFGAMTGLAVLLVKFSCIASLCDNVPLLLGALLIVPAWARWCELYAIGRFPYARPEGKGKIWHDSTNFPADLFKGLLIPLMVSVTTAAQIGLSPTLLIIAFGLVSGLVASHWLASHIEGHTGDTYGAVVELSEAGCLLFTSIVLS